MANVFHSHQTLFRLTSTIQHLNISKSTMNFKIVLFVFALIIAFFTQTSDACQEHDRPCQGRNGFQGNCCGGMHCQKNNPSWAEGRCYYNPGK